MAKIKLSVLQDKFLWSIAKLIFYAHEAGYTVTLGRGKVTPEENAAEGGIPDSLHLIGLAQDLNFYLNGVWLTQTEDLRIFGDWWKMQGADYAWGGDFVVNGKAKPDGNHFSYAYGGHK